MVSEYIEVLSYPSPSPFFFAFRKETYNLSGKA